MSQDEKSLSSAERSAWILHALAVELEHHAENRPNTPDKETFYKHLAIVMQVSLRARTALVREFGNNLDKLYDDARDRYDELYKECEKKHEQEKLSWKALDELLSNVASRKGGP